MKEYIEREAVIKIIDNYAKTVTPDCREVVDAIRDIVSFICPNAEVQEVRHGEWTDKGSLSCRCSECGCKSNRESNFCPNCGAKMDEE